MNGTPIDRRGEVLRFAAVYALLPLLCLLCAVGIVLMQFVTSRIVFPEASLPLYRQLAVVNRAFAAEPNEEEQEGFSALLLSELDLPTGELDALPEAPKGVYPIVTTTIPLGNGLINATDYSADLSVMASATPMKQGEDDPCVLVLHTHATESFYDPDASPLSTVVMGQSADVFGYYEEGLSPRSTDTEENMVSVGRVFCDTLEEMGISTVHCETLHDLDYSQAYANSLSSAQEYLKKYPNIRYIIDLHRDSLVRDNGTKLKPTCTVDGKSTAQVMLVVGAGSKDLPQPGWKKNLAVSARYQSYLEQAGDGFARPVYLRYGRFNQHLSANTMLLEVGSCGNTLEEAQRAGKLAAEALGKMILEAK